MRRGRAVLYTRGQYLVAAPADEHTLARVLGQLRDTAVNSLDDGRLS
jgi:hypothetical protein